MPKKINTDDFIKMSIEKHANLYYYTKTNYNGNRENVIITCKIHGDFEQTQEVFDGCKYKRNLPFDFYLPELNICIEFDGKQHYTPIKFFGGDDNYKKQKIRDNIKNEYCIKNNIKLFRIKYDENIEEKINEILNEI